MLKNKKELLVDAIAITQSDVGDVVIGRLVPSGELVELYPECDNPFFGDANKTIHVQLPLNLKFGKDQKCQN